MEQADRLNTFHNTYKIIGTAFEQIADEIGLDSSTAYGLLQFHPHADRLLKECDQQAAGDPKFRYPGWRTALAWMCEGRTSRKPLPQRTWSPKEGLPTPHVAQVGKKYGAICVDPPWPFDHPKPSTKSVTRHYPTLLVDDLTALPVQEFAADHCALFLWTPDSHLAHAMGVITAWGFTYKTVAFHWVKTTEADSYHVGLGWWTRANPEICLLATRGHPQRLHNDVRLLVVSPVREHSRKPDEIYSEMIPRLVGGPYLELFARTRRAGWDVNLSNEPTRFGVNDNSICDALAGAAQ